MSDYISKAQVLDIYAELYDIFDGNRAIIKELNKIYDKINGLVNIEAKPVKHGRWIEAENDSLISGHCSSCGWKAHMYEDDVIGMPYCPNCGAKMDGEGDGYYEAAVEMAQYCERYEPTYDPENGSM